MSATPAVLGEVLQERIDQAAKWGEQNHPDGTGGLYEAAAETARARCDAHARAGSVTWAHIFREEAYEALAESDEARLREELVQVAAVAVAWVEAIDRRRA
jgi:hypothetical protein